jgi:NAD(P)H-flavin reductase/hemoglobin-like flavoprotein
VAIALDGGIPDSSSDGPAGQRRRVRFDSKAEGFSRPVSTLTQSYVGLNTASNDDAIPDRLARTESAAPPPAGTDSSVSAADFDTALIRESLGRLLAGPDVAECFYGRLKAVSPDAAALFPPGLAAQREQLVGTLGRIMRSIGSEAGLAEVLACIGRESRKFGVTDRHYSAFAVAMQQTVRELDPAGWPPDAESAWVSALRYMCAAMRAAAAADAAVSPPWWIAEITSHSLRAPGVAVLKLAPTEPMPYRAGQYLWVQVTRWPRVWRQFSAATAPRPGGAIELHVRAVPGGLVSNTLVHHSAAGDTLVLGAAEGGMTLADSGRDLLCVAGGTGLAPIKAIVEQAISEAAGGRARKITLFYGARQHFDLYDLQDLQLLESAYPALHVIPVLSDEPGFSGLTGLVPDVVHAYGSGMFRHCEAYICGPPGMVSRTAALLAASIPAAQIHHDPL